MSRHSRGRGQKGFTLIELLAVILMIGLAAAMFTPYIQKMVRHERLRSSVREVYSIVLAARMQAVKRNQQVIVWFDLPNHRVISWADNLPYNYVQDAGEQTLASYEVPQYIYFHFAPAGVLDGAGAVAFDTYAGNASFTDRVIFQGDGTLLPPAAANSGRPLRPTVYTATVPSGSVNCNAGGGRARGIYMSDEPLTGDVPNRNTFRISVDDFGSTGRASLLKWISTPDGGNAGEYDYVPGPWRWNP